MHSPGDKFFADTAFTADHDSGVGGRNAGNSIANLVEQRAAADEFGFNGQLLAEFVELTFDARKADRELFALTDGFENASELVGDSQRKLEAVGIQRPPFHSDVKVDQADDGACVTHRSADRTFRGQAGNAVARHQQRVLSNVVRQQRLVIVEDNVGQILGESGVLAASNGNHPQLGRVVAAGHGRKKKNAADICVRPFHDAFKHAIGKRNSIDSGVHRSGKLEQFGRPRPFQGRPPGPVELRAPFSLDDRVGIAGRHRIGGHQVRMDVGKHHLAGAERDGLTEFEFPVS